MRLGVFGGTFDPPHVGHLLTAVDAVEALTLDRLLFVPAAQQPLKVGCESAAPEHRLAMARLLAGDDPRFQSAPLFGEWLRYAHQPAEQQCQHWKGVAPP